MSAIMRIALADWQARTRSFTFVLVAAFALQLAYLFVPDAHANYVTVAIGGVRGIYNAPWMGSIIAICTSMILAFIGFFLVRGSLARDEIAGCAGIVAASPVSRFAFVAGKWGSNTAILVVVASVLAAGGAVMQQVRGENHAFDLASYVDPMVLMVFPLCALVAAFAVLFDAIRPLRGVAGGVLWFFIVNGLLTGALIGWTNGRLSPAADPFGIAPLISAMRDAAHAAFPGVNVNDFSIGGGENTDHRTFLWHGMLWTPAIVAARAVWLAIALAIVALASLAFDRFAGTRAKARATWRFPVARIVPDVPGLRLLRAELAVLAGESGFWWTLAAIGCGIAGLFVPASGMNVVLPLALLLPLPRYGSLGTRDRLTGVDALIRSAPHAVTRTIVARIVAAGLIGCVPLAGTLVRYPALAVVPFAAAALAIALGTLTGAPRVFECLYLAVWYFGVLNHLPFADLPADALVAPAVFVTAGLATILIAGAGTRLRALV
jgi:hypothetical protein